MNEKPLKIVALEAENFKRLRAVHIRPDGKPIVSVIGQNGAGKTSCLDAIWAALGGEKAAPAVPIRRGAETAEVTVELGEPGEPVELVVTRKWNAKGSQLTVKSPDGMKIGSPQAVLDKLASKFGFDPLAFTRAKGADQVETLKSLVGLDFRLLDVQRKTAYDQRTEVNREVARLRGQLESIPIVNAPDEPVSVAEILKEQDQQLAVQRQHDALQRTATEATKTLARANEWVARAKEALAEAQKELEEAEAAATAAREGEEEAAGELSLASKGDLTAVREKLAKAEQTNAAVRAKKEREAAAEKLRAKEKEAAGLTEKVEAADKSKADALAKAEFPVPGLSFDDAGVILNGVPLAQASAAEQLRVSLAIGLRLNPRLRVVLIRDGSLLDEKSLRIVAEMAQEADAQVWIEKVGSASDTGVIIEDGAVLSGGASVEAVA